MSPAPLRRRHLDEVYDRLYPVRPGSDDRGERPERGARDDAGHRAIAPGMCRRCVDFVHLYNNSIPAKLPTDIFHAPSIRLLISRFLHDPIHAFSPTRSSPRPPHMAPPAHLSRRRALPSQAADPEQPREVAPVGHTSRRSRERPLPGPQAPPSDDPKLLPVNMTRPSRPRIRSCPRLPHLRCRTRRRLRTTGPSPGSHT